MTFEQWLAGRQHELRTRYGNEHLGAMKIDEYKTWLRERYELEHPTISTEGSPNG